MLVNYGNTILFEPTNCILWKTYICLFPGDKKPSAKDGYGSETLLDSSWSRPFFMPHIDPTVCENYRGIKLFYGSKFFIHSYLMLNNLKYGRVININIEKI